MNQGSQDSGIIGKVRELQLKLGKTWKIWKNQGIFEKDWCDFSNFKHSFRNTRFVISILCRKFSFKQPE